MNWKTAILLLISLSVFASSVSDSDPAKNNANKFLNSESNSSTDNIDRSNVGLSELPFEDCPGIQITGINREDRVLLNRTTWTDLPGMNLSCSNTEGNPVLISFSASLNDRVGSYYGGLVELRLLRDDEQIAHQRVGFDISPLYNDLTASITHTDTPPAGEHTYRVEYKINNSGYRAFTDVRNLQIYTK